MGALWVLLFLLLIYAVLAKFFGYLKGLGVFIGLFVLMIVYVNIGIRHECVVMHNGLLIGRATFFSSMIGWNPDIAIKYPDGRLIRRGDGSINIYDHESVGGDYPGTVKGKYNKFIYIKDVGLLIQSETPDEFQYYWDKKKKDPSNVPPEKTDKYVKRLKLPPWRWNADTGRWYKREHSDNWRWVDSSGGNLYLLYMILRSNPENRRKWCPTAWFSP